MNKYRLCIKGKNPDYFLKKVISSKINIYDISKKYNELFIIVDEIGYQKISEFKTSYKIMVVGVSGLAKIKEVCRKYFFFILFFCFGICLNIFLSKVIFKVEVIHSNSYIKDLVYNELEKRGIKKYNLKVDFAKKEAITQEILANNSDYLEWLEIEECGTKYIVHVQQRKKNEEKEDCQKRNIVAKKSAMILEIKANSGEVLKKKLDYVVAGDIIISGSIYNKEDIVTNRCAEGQVFGEVWYKVLVSLPTSYHEENVTGKSIYNVEVNFLDKKYKLFNKYDSYKKKDLIVLKNKLIPWSFEIGKYLETKIIDQTYTLENCEKEAIDIATARVSKQFKEGEEVLTKKVLKKEIKNSKIIVEIFLKVKEDITDYREITDEEIVNQDKNKDGD